VAPAGTTIVGAVVVGAAVVGVVTVAPFGVVDGGGPSPDRAGLHPPNAAAAIRPVPARRKVRRLRSC
jgi:hypothetical protein